MYPGLTIGHTRLAPSASLWLLIGDPSRPSYASNTGLGIGFIELHVLPVGLWHSEHVDKRDTVVGRTYPRAALIVTASASRQTFRPYSQSRPSKLADARQEPRSSDVRGLRLRDTVVSSHSGVEQHVQAGSSDRTSSPTLHGRAPGMASSPYVPFGAKALSSPANWCSVPRKFLKCIRFSMLNVLKSA